MRRRIASWWRTAAMDAGAHVDDRQQPEVGREPGAGSRAECGLRPACAHLGLEKQEIRPGPGRLLILDRFADLQKHF